MSRQGPPSPEARPDTDRRRLHVVLNVLGPLAFIVLFRATGRLVDAAWGLLGGAALSLLATYALDRRLAPVPLVLGVLALLFGGLTVAFQSADVLKMEITIRSLAVGLTLLGTLACGLNPLKTIIGRVLRLTDAAWRTLGYRLGFFNIAIAVANLIVWHTQSDPVWVAFRFPGLLVLHLVFLACQLPLILAARREMGADDASIGLHR